MVLFFNRLLVKLHFEVGAEMSSPLTIGDGQKSVFLVLTVDPKTVLFHCLTLEIVARFPSCCKALTNDTVIGHCSSPWPCFWAQLSILGFLCVVSLTSQF